MTINLSMPKSQSDLRPSILVVGVGGAGGNAVNNMIRSNLEGVDFVVCNTDAQSLDQSLSERKIQLGLGTTEGLGAGSRPEIGAAAAEEALDEARMALADRNAPAVERALGRAYSAIVEADPSTEVRSSEILATEDLLNEIPLVDLSEEE